MKRYWTCSTFEPRCARRMCPYVFPHAGQTTCRGCGGPSRHDRFVVPLLEVTGAALATKPCGTTGFFVVGGLDTREPYGFWHFDHDGIETRASAHELEVCPTQHRYLPRTS